MEIYMLVKIKTVFF